MCSDGKTRSHGLRHSESRPHLLRRAAVSTHQMSQQAIKKNNYNINGLLLKVGL